MANEFKELDFPNSGTHLSSHPIKSAIKFEFININGLSFFYTSENLVYVANHFLSHLPKTIGIENNSLAENLLMLT